MTFGHTLCGVHMIDQRKLVMRFFQRSAHEHQVNENLSVIVIQFEPPCQQTVREGDMR